MPIELIQLTLGDNFNVLWWTVEVALRVIYFMILYFNFRWAKINCPCPKSIQYNYYINLIMFFKLFKDIDLQLYSIHDFFLQEVCYYMCMNNIAPSIVFILGNSCYNSKETYYC